MATCHSRDPCYVVWISIHSTSTSLLVELHQYVRNADLHKTSFCLQIRNVWTDTPLLVLKNSHKQNSIYHMLSHSTSCCEILNMLYGFKLLYLFQSIIPLRLHQALPLVRRLTHNKYVLGWSDILHRAWIGRGRKLNWALTLLLERSQETRHEILV